MLWYGTRAYYFDRSGKAIKCYVLTRDGKVTYGERPGIDPATGRQCRPIKVEILERLKEYETGKRPQRITDANPTFFDPRTGEPIVWYYRSKDNEIEIFDLMGFHPDTGEELIPITKELVEQWKLQVAHVKQRVPKLVDPGKYVFFDERTGQPRAWYWRSVSGQYEFYDNPGFQSQTGEPLTIVTRSVVDDWKKHSEQQRTEKEPQRVDPNTYAFFDPLTGTARVWYWYGGGQTWEFYNGPGFQPRTGDKLQIVTKELVAKWKDDTAPAPTPEKRSDLAPQKQQPLETFATTFFTNYMRLSEGEPSNLLPFVQQNFANSVEYYGKRYTLQQVIQDKQNYIIRWPKRSYKPRSDTIRVSCNATQSYCEIIGGVDFRVATFLPANPISVGVAVYQFGLEFSDGKATVVSENGKIVSRSSGYDSAVQSQFPDQSEIQRQNQMTSQQTQKLFGAILSTVLGRIEDDSKSGASDIQETFRNESLRVQGKFVRFTQWATDGQSCPNGASCAFAAFVIENLSGQGITAAIRRGSTSIGACIGYEADAAGLNLYGQPQTLYYSFYPDFKSAQRYIPAGKNTCHD